MYKNLIGAAIALSVGISTSAQAVDINTGFGNITGVSGLDWSPNSALAVDSLNLAVSPAQSTFELFSQASLANFTNAAGGAITPNFGLNSNYEVTFELGFGEVGSIAGGVAAVFGIDPAATTNFFNVYYDTNVNANPLAGTGYDDGALILTGVVVDGFGTFVLNPATAGTENLDQFGVDNYAGQQTVDGVGSNNIDVDLQAQNQGFNFFLDDITNLVMDLVLDSNAATPFEQVDPSALVVGRAPDFGLDGVNGICGDTDTCDFLFQTDAASAIREEVEEVPEPSLIALMGIGFIGMAVSNIRRKRS